MFISMCLFFSTIKHFHASKLSRYMRSLWKSKIRSNTFHLEESVKVKTSKTWNKLLKEAGLNGAQPYRRGHPDTMTNPRHINNMNIKGLKIFCKPSMLWDDQLRKGQLNWTQDEKKWVQLSGTVWYFAH